MPSQIVHSGGATTNYLYDGMGTRVKKSIGSTHTYYIGEHFEVKSGTITRYVFAGNLRVAQVKGGVRSFFHKDHLGSSTVMTDASGAEVESTEYMPFGSQRNHSGTNTSDYRFTDQELDAENRLYNYGARLYDPFIGRFISPDTFVQAPHNPQALNRYSYCLNNPLRYTDPSGHFWKEIGDAFKWVGEQLDRMMEIFPSICGGLWDLYSNISNSISNGFNSIFGFGGGNVNNGGGGGITVHGTGSSGGASVSGGGGGPNLAIATGGLAGVTAAVNAWVNDRSVDVSFDKLKRPNYQSTGPTMEGKVFGKYGWANEFIKQEGSCATRLSNALNRAGSLLMCL